VGGTLHAVEEMFPEPLYESMLTAGGHLCLVCGDRPATSALRTPGRSEPIVPLCNDCAGDWRIYGYLILRRIKPAALIWKMTRFFVMQPFRRRVIWSDLAHLQRWQKKISRLRRGAG